MKYLLLLCFSLSTSLFSQKTTIPLTHPHPAWILRGNIYEVNVRQYTKEGTLNAFAKNLDRIHAMGVQTLWFMPLNPISVVDRKGSLGSYYAVADYNALNPEFGTMADWMKLVAAIHAKGMKVLIDWVPNHTGGDNVWLTRHPDFFVKDSSGKAAMAKDWADTRQLDYGNPEMQDSMIAAMKYWLVKSNIDGFRCDVAWNVPGAFWSKCIGELKRVKDVFMLAEGDSAYLPQHGFDAVYPWHMFHMMEKIAHGDRPAFALDSVRLDNEATYPAQTIEMYFTSNHDENSWNKADYGSFPGNVHAPFAVFTQTMENSVPLIYGGQEEPILRAIQFFDKDPMVFGGYKRSAFYHTLLDLRQHNPALSANARFRKLIVGDEKTVYAYVRQQGENKVLVILNLSGTQQSISIKDKTMHGLAYNVFMGANETLTANEWKLEPWGYSVYSYPTK